MAKKATALPDTNLKDLTLLRRYLDLPKYIHLLCSKSLYLRRADCFTDRFEGALPPAIRKAIDSAQDLNALNEGADVFYRRCRMGTFVNCWTLGKQDNMALWQLYGGATASVAVNTTAKRLRSICLGLGGKALLQRVQYIDHFENPKIVFKDYTDPLKVKHEAFKYEQEVRILLSQQENWESNPEGLHLPVPDLSTLVTSVIVAPEARQWFFDLVLDLTQRYGLTVPVRMSKLASPP